MPTVAERNAKALIAASYQELVQTLTSEKIRDVGNYHIEKLIGKGTYGKVYLATHHLTNTTVVLKGTSKSEAANLAREIHHHRQLRHPHVTRLYEVICTESTVWLVLEHCPGGELYDYLLQHPRFEEESVKRLFSQLVGAVRYVHSRNCVHRDLKLENILLDKHGNVKLGDFGFTREYQTSKMLETWCGTVAYAAPEMIRGEKYSGEGNTVDVWSLGVILYALLCRELPFDEENENQTRQLILGQEPQYPEFVSTEARGLLSKLLNKNAVRRPSLDQILVSEFLAPYGAAQLEILTTPVPPMFSSKIELELLERLGKCEVSRDRIVASVSGDRCDALAGLWALLLETLHRRERKQERKKRMAKTTTNGSGEVVQQSPASSNKTAATPVTPPQRTVAKRRPSLLTTIKAWLTDPKKMRDQKDQREKNERNIEPQETDVLAEYLLHTPANVIREDAARLREHIIPQLSLTPAVSTEKHHHHRRNSRPGYGRHSSTSSSARSARRKSISKTSSTSSVSVKSGKSPHSPTLSRPTPGTPPPFAFSHNRRSWGDGSKTLSTSHRRISSLKRGPVHRVIMNHQGKKASEAITEEDETEDQDYEDIDDE